MNRPLALLVTLAVAFAGLAGELPNGRPSSDARVEERVQ